MALPSKSIKAAVISPGLRQVETILLTCCLGAAFLGEEVGAGSGCVLETFAGVRCGVPEIQREVGHCGYEKAYMSGLMHDIGFMVNRLIFSREFATAMERALREEIPLDEAERVTMGIHPLRDRAGAGGTMETGGRRRRGDRASSCRRAKPEGTTTSGAGALE